MKNQLSLAASDKLYFTSREFDAQISGKAFHGFFGRNGGVSNDVYATLNCGVGSDDDDATVADNRAVAAAAAGCAAERLLGVCQVHGDVCVTVKEPWSASERPEADSMVSDVAGIGLGILTADCAPVLFYGQKVDGSPVIGAAHAGWGGALGGVLAATVAGMVKLGAVEEGLSACIGPCIGQASYEVRDDFADAFLKEDDENERFFMAGQKSGHLMFDLSGYCAFKLFKAGVKRVSIKGLDTYFNEEDFFSYRRATHRMEKDYGRQISVIMINEN